MVTYFEKGQYKCEKIKQKQGKKPQPNPNKNHITIPKNYQPKKDTEGVTKGKV